MESALVSQEEDGGAAGHGQGGGGQDVLRVRQVRAQAVTFTTHLLPSVQGRKGSPACWRTSESEIMLKCYFIWSGAVKWTLLVILT